MRPYFNHTYAIDRVRRVLALVTGLALFLVTGAVNLQVPLYPAYAAAAGYGTGLTAIVCAVYAAGVLPVLIGLGGLSDQAGRRPVVIAGLISAAAATAVVWAFPTMHALFIARLLQGVGVGLSLGAGTAYLAELIGGDVGPTRAAAITATTSAIGFGGGALATSVFLLFGDASIPPSYAGAFILIVVCGLVLFFLPRPEPSDTVAAHDILAGDRYPQRRWRGRLLRLPAFPTGCVLPGAAIALAWTVSALVIAVVPTQLRTFGLAAWAGPVLFAVYGAGALVQPHARRLAATNALRLGVILLPFGYAALVIGAWFGWLSLVISGAAIAGSAAYGYTYLGGLTEVSRLGGAERARATSGYFLCAYLGFSIPVIAVGYLAAAIGIANALILFGIIVIAASAILLFLLVRRLRKLPGATGRGDR